MKRRRKCRIVCVGRVLLPCFFKVISAAESQDRSVHREALSHASGGKLRGRSDIEVS